MGWKERRREGEGEKPASNFGGKSGGWQKLAERRR